MLARPPLEEEGVTDGETKGESGQREEESFNHYSQFVKDEESSLSEKE